LPACRDRETGEVVAEGVAVLHQHRRCTQQYVPDAPTVDQGIHPVTPPHLSQIGCSGSPADCTDLGMTYVKSDSRGDGRKCWTGTKVYCSGYPAPDIAFMGYDACDGFQCHRTMCGSNPSPGPRVIASESWYFCPLCGSTNLRRIMGFNKIPNAQIARACPWRYF
jgi:hypothetical protein